VKWFLEGQAPTSKRTIRIALIYPSCRNITRYLNESDVEVVQPDKPADGVHFVTFDRLPEFFASRARK